MRKLMPRSNVLMEVMEWNRQKASSQITRVRETHSRSSPKDVFFFCGLIPVTSYLWQTQLLWIAKNQSSFRAYRGLVRIPGESFPWIFYRKNMEANENFLLVIFHPNKQSIQRLDIFFERFQIRLDVLNHYGVDICPTQANGAHHISTMRSRML